MESPDASPTWSYLVFGLLFFPILWTRSAAMLICYGIVVAIWSSYISEY